MMRQGSYCTVVRLSTNLVWAWGSKVDQVPRAIVMRRRRSVDARIEVQLSTEVGGQEADGRGHR